MTDTRGRLLAAATQEFARFGLAGGRVDRIAAAAECNKQLIYAYFGSKDQLFERVLADRVGELLTSVPFTPSDLPGYAVRLFDYFAANEQLVRLARWSELERPGELNALPSVRKATAEKVAALGASRGRQGNGLSAQALLDAIVALTAAAADRVFASGSRRAAVSLQRASLQRTVAHLSS